MVGPGMMIRAIGKRVALAVGWSDFSRMISKRVALAVGWSDFSRMISKRGALAAEGMDMVVLGMWGNIGGRGEGRCRV